MSAYNELIQEELERFKTALESLEPATNQLKAHRKAEELYLEVLTRIEDLHKTFVAEIGQPLDNYRQITKQAQGLIETLKTIAFQNRLENIEERLSDTTDKVEGFAEESRGAVRKQQEANSEILGKFEEKSQKLIEEINQLDVPSQLNKFNQRLEDQLTTVKDNFNEQSQRQLDQQLEKQQEFEGIFREKSGALVEEIRGLEIPDRFDKFDRRLGERLESVQNTMNALNLGIQSLQSKMDTVKDRQEQQFSILEKRLAKIETNQKSSLQLILETLNNLTIWRFFSKRKQVKQ